MAAPRLLTRAKPWLPWAAVSAVLAVVTIRAILTETGGEPAVPLDDTFIHFQYAKSFASGKPLAYSPGAPPTPGYFYAYSICAFTQMVLTSRPIQEPMNNSI